LWRKTLWGFRVQRFRGSGVQRFRSSKFQGAGYWVLDYWILGTGYWVLDTGDWLRVVENGIEQSA